MMINNLEHTSSSSVSSCRQTTLSDKAAEHVRRKRMEVRRLKSMCQSHPDFAADNLSCKKKRFGAMNSGDLSQGRSVRTTSSVVVLPENDVRMGGRENPSSSHGSISVIGRRREMEDAVAVELGFMASNSMKYDFYGVYDGHGGSSVAHTCCNRLHRLMIKEVEEQQEQEVGMRSANWEKVMVESFRKMDEEVMNTEAVGSIGSTAVVAVVGEKLIVVANCGDSRAVLSRGGVPIAMSNDHKPDRPDELKRIEDSGGRVIDWNGQRVLGVLATSRSIGDKHLKPYVIPQPEVMVRERSNDDEFLILASDGVWDVIPNELACEVLRRCLNGRMRRRSSESRTTNEEGSSESVVKERRATEAAVVLAKLAIARGSKDNISIVVVELNKPN